MGVDPVTTKDYNPLRHNSTHLVMAGNRAGWM